MAYSRAANGSLLGPFKKLYRAVQEKGLDGCMKQLYMVCYFPNNFINHQQIN